MRVRLRPVFGAVGAVGAADEHELLAVQAKAVVVVQLHALRDAFVGDGARAASNLRKAGQRETDADRAVAAATGVTQGESRLEAAAAGDDFKRNFVEGAAGVGDGELAAQGHVAGGGGGDRCGGVRDPRGVEGWGLEGGGCRRS